MHEELPIVSKLILPKLFYRVAKGKIKYLQKAIEAGIDVNSAEQDDWRLLHVAACAPCKSIKMSDILLKEGADVNAVTTKNLTALFIAAQNGNESLVKFLLKNNANPHIDANLGPILSPMAIAALNNRCKVIKILLRHDKKLVHRKSSKSDCTPLHYAASDGLLEPLAVLINGGAEIDALNMHGRSPLCFASDKGHYECAQYLLLRGADVNAQGQNQYPLHVAAQQGRSKIVKLLLAYKAPINNQITTGDTPLITALVFGHQRTALLLIRKGADITIKNIDGATAVHAAAQMGCDKVLKVLLENGAAINELTLKGATPLMLACFYDKPDCVKALLGRGEPADITLKTPEGLTALQIAQLYKPESTCIQIVQDFIKNKKLPG